MPSTYSRRDVLRVGGVTFGLGTAGCLGDSPGGNDSHDTTVSNSTTSGSTSTRTDSPTTRTTSTTSERTTVAPSDVSDEAARERALTAEEAFLTEQLRNAPCLTNWGTSETTASTYATVTDRTADGVYVDVQHAYWYSTEDAEADGASTAVYVVTADSIRRDRGDSISPC